MHRPARNPCLGVVLAIFAMAACRDATQPSVPLADTRIRWEGGSRALFDSLSSWIGYVDAQGQLTTPMLIDTVALGGPTANARTFQQGDAGFAQVAGLLTDGVDEPIERGVRGGGGGASTTSLESFFFNGGISGNLTPDFHGHVVTTVQLVVDTMTFATPGSDPNGDGLWTDYLMVGRLLVEGYPE